MANISVATNRKKDNANEIEKNNLDNSCTFCNFKSHSAQDCRFLKKYKLSNSEIIKDFIKNNIKPKNKNNTKKSDKKTSNLTLTENHENMKNLRIAYIINHFSLLNSWNSNCVQSKYIILDNAANISIINDLNLSIEKTDLVDPVIVTDVSNTLVSSKILCKTKYFGSALFMPDAPFNIISFSN